MRGQSAAGRRSDELVPIDLLVALGITVALNVAVFVPVVRETPGRVPLGLLFVCFVPGYVLVAALFPEAHSESRQLDTGPISSIRTVFGGSGITVLERCLLAVACSVIVVPCVGYLLNFTPWGIRLTPVLVATSVVTVVATLVAWVRRVRHPPETRFRTAEAVGPLRLGWLTGDGGTSKTATYLLVGSLVFFALSSGYAVVGGSPGESYSELYLLSAEGEELVDGNLSAPTGEPRTLQLGVNNHEGRPVTYTVVVLGQQVVTAENETVIRDQTRLNAFELSVDSGESRTAETIVPATADSDRVVWLLYTGDVPDEVSPRTAPYSVNVWLSGTERGDGTREGAQVVTAERDNTTREGPQVVTTERDERQ
jgi:uncharacterized membrane protein